jgi:hypothetical protein
MKLFFKLRIKKLFLPLVLLQIATVSSAQEARLSAQRYEVVKEVGLRLANARYEQFRLECIQDSECEVETDLKEDPINIETCSGWGTLLGIYSFSGDQDKLLASEIDAGFLEIAGVIEDGRNVLTDSGYPLEIWQPKLLEIEKFAVKKYIANGGEWNLSMQEGIDRLFLEIVDLAKDYKISNGLDLADLSYESECGAGGPAMVNLETDPPGGEISIISEFEYLLCETSGQSTDELSCDGWVTVSTDSMMALGGFYYVRMRYGSEETLARLTDLTNIHQGQVVRIKK